MPKMEEYSPNCGGRPAKSPYAKLFFQVRKKSEREMTQVSKCEWELEQLVSLFFDSTSGDIISNFTLWRHHQSNC